MRSHKHKAGISSEHGGNKQAKRGKQEKVGTTKKGSGRKVVEPKSRNTVVKGTENLVLVLGMEEFE